MRAAGSGTTIKEVSQLVDEHKRFAKMIGKMGKMGKGKPGGMDMSQMQRNPGAMIKQLQNVMDPRMMQQVARASSGDRLLYTGRRCT